MARGSVQRRPSIHSMVSTRGPHRSCLTQGILTLGSFVKLRLKSCSSRHASGDWWGAALLLSKQQGVLTFWGARPLLLIKQLRAHVAQHREAAFCESCPLTGSLHQCSEGLQAERQCSGPPQQGHGQAVHQVPSRALFTGHFTTLASHLQEAKTLSAQPLASRGPNAHSLVFPESERRDSAAAQEGSQEATASL